MEATGEVLRQQHEKLIQEQLLLIPASQQLGWLIRNLATTRAVCDELRGLRESSLYDKECLLFGNEDAKRSSVYRAEIRSLRARLSEEFD